MKAKITLSSDYRVELRENESNPHFAGLVITNADGSEVTISAWLVTMQNIGNNINSHCQRYWSRR